MDRGWGVGVDQVDGGRFFCIFSKRKGDALDERPADAQRLWRPYLHAVICEEETRLCFVDKLLGRIMIAEEATTMW